LRDTLSEAIPRTPKSDNKNKFANLNLYVGFGGGAPPRGAEGVIDSSLSPCYTPCMDELRKAERERFIQNIRELGRWLAPGLGIKRWFFFVLGGITFLGIGLAILVLNLYRMQSTDPAILTILDFLSLRFLPRALRVLI